MIVARKLSRHLAMSSSWPQQRSPCYSRGWCSCECVQKMVIQMHNSQLTQAQLTQATTVSNVASVICLHVSLYKSFDRRIYIFCTVLLSRTQDSRTRTKTRTWKLVIEDPRGQGLSSRTTTLLRGSTVRSRAVYGSGEIDMNLNLTGAQWQISHPFVTQSLQDDGAWYFACYISLLNPRKFSRTWTSEYEDKDKDLKLVLEDPRGQRLSSRTTTLILHSCVYSAMEGDDRIFPLESHRQSMEQVGCFLAPWYLLWRLSFVGPASHKFHCLAVPV